MRYRNIVLGVVFLALSLGVFTTMALAMPPEPIPPPTSYKKATSFQGYLWHQGSLSDTYTNDNQFLIVYCDTYWFCIWFHRANVKFYFDNVKADKLKLDLTYTSWLLKKPSLKVKYLDGSITNFGGISAGSHVKDLNENKKIDYVEIDLDYYVTLPVPFPGHIAIDYIILQM